MDILIRENSLCNCIIIIVIIEHEKRKRRYSPARHNGSLPHIVTPPLPLTNGSSHTHTFLPPSPLHTPTLTNHSVDSLEKKTPTHFSGTPVSQIKLEHNLYDAIPPATTSLPPPTPSTTLSGYDNHKLRTSAYFLSQDAPLSQEVKRLSSSLPDTLDLDLPIAGLESLSVNHRDNKDIKSKRRSWSVPDTTLDLDLPVIGLEPISINKDILELEESYRLVASGKLVRKWNGHFVGYSDSRDQMRALHIDVSTEV